MSSKKCCVPKCKGLGVTLHIFPHPLKESVRFAEWVHAVGGDIVGLSNELIFRNRRVCHHHFEEKYLCRSGRLSNVAVPTLNLPGLTVPKFLSTAPLLQIQKISSMPSTSKGIAAELSSPFSLSENNPVMDVDENTGPLAVSKTSLTEPLRQVQNIPSMPSTSKELLPGSTSELFPTLLRSTQVMDVDENKENINNTEQLLVKTTNPATSKPAPLLPNNNHYSKQVSACVLTKKKPDKKHTAKSAEQKLYKKLLNTRVKLAKIRNKVLKQKTILDKSKKLITNPTFLKAMEDLPTCTKILTKLQFRELKKKNKGRRFTLQEKILALSIYKQSPKAYKFLRKILVLPAQQVLKKVIQRANLKAGINDKLFEQLKHRAEKMKSVNKLCILIFDEMAIGANLSYNERKDEVVGFVNNGSSRKQEYADHAQVFMIRGLMENFKQAISYSFSASATKGVELCRQIKEIICEIQKTGLVVVATICDQGTNNRHAINLLVAEYKAECLRSGIEPISNIIKINNEIIVPLYDPPHMLKCLRNNLLTKNLIYTMDGKTKCAKWEHLQYLMKENPGYKGVRLIPKLTDYHVLPHKIPKMKVKYATEIFSTSVAKNMGYLADKGVLPMECKDTADVLFFFDSLFDSVNGSFGKNSHAKPLLGAVRDNTQHHKFWRTAKVVLSTMKFVNKTTNKPEKVPTVNNWMWTLDNIQILLKNLKKDYKVNSVWMRHLNQDPIENFFGAIRSHGCRDNNPTAEKFESAFASLLINNMSSAHAVGANCEEDLCENLHALVISSTACHKPATTWEFENIPDIEILNLEQKTDPRIMAPLEYVSGYFYNQAEKKIFKNCETCKLNLSGSVVPEYIQRREFGGGRWLKTPSHELLVTVSNLQDVIYTLIKQNLEKTMIKEFIKTIILMFINFEFLTCPEHKEKLTEFIINIVCRFFIYNYCKNINRILKGKRDCEDNEDTLAIKAKKYNLKCLKRKK